MITEEQIRKVAKSILGEEGGEFGWVCYTEREKSFVRRVEIKCSHCLVNHHVLYDLRESTVCPERMRMIKLPREA